VSLRVGRFVTFVDASFEVECISEKFLVMLDEKFKCGYCRTRGRGFTRKEERVGILFKDFVSAVE
jgi:hypothetical protein